MYCRLLLYFAFIFLLIGCNIKPDTCKDQSSRTMKIGFYSTSGTGSRRILTDGLLTKIKITRGSLVVQDTAGLSKLALPLLQGTNKEGNDIDSLAFSISMSITLNNKKTVALTPVTLYTIYKQDRIFENYKCGFRTNFILDKVYASPKDIFDSIIIVQPYISDVYQENCKLYFSNDSTKHP